MSRRQRFTQVDAFTDRPFSGNPAAVCVLPEPADPTWMQQVAREMNLAETAFLVRQRDGFDLRWFTPTTEVDLCGHATLASAHVLWEEQQLRSDEPIRFHTRSGVLAASREPSLIWLDLPATPSRPAPEVADLSRGIGTRLRYVGRTAFDYLVELDSEATVRELLPDLTALARLPVRGVIVTARSEGGTHDFVSRFFAPGAGVPEDPVTGSAHCGLAPFWAERLNKTELVGYQASERGGFVAVRLEGSRVRLGGQAVTVLQGELLYQNVNPVEAFGLLDLRVGRVVRAEPNERARKPSYKLWIDFGPLGEKTSSAQLRALYRADQLVGRLIIAAVNLGSRNIAGFRSEVLVLGLPNAEGEVVLLGVEREVPLGGRVY